MSNVFSQAKDLYKMQAEARDMQKKMKDIIVSGKSKKDTVEVRMNGLNEVVDIDIDPEAIDKDQKKALEKAIKQALKDATKKLQKEMMKDMDMDRLKSMLS